jgi:hypothetical protein
MVSNIPAALYPDGRTMSPRTPALLMSGMHASLFHACSVKVGRDLVTCDMHSVFLWGQGYVSVYHLG